MTHSAKERLKHYFIEWGHAVAQFDRLGIWAVIVTMLGIQTITTALVFQSHGVGPGAMESMGTVFLTLIVIVFAWTVRCDQIAAAVVTEIAYHLGYVGFAPDGESERLEAVWGGGAA